MRGRGKLIALLAAAAALLWLLGGWYLPGPLDKDTDHDTISDQDEVGANKPDTDGDGLSDKLENFLHSNPLFAISIGPPNKPIGARITDSHHSTPRSAVGRMVCASVVIAARIAADLRW